MELIEIIRMVAAVGVALPGVVLIVAVLLAVFGRNGGGHRNGLPVGVVLYQSARTAALVERAQRKAEHAARTGFRADLVAGGRYA